MLRPLRVLLAAAMKSQRKPLKQRRWVRVAHHREEIAPSSNSDLLPEPTLQSEEESFRCLGLGAFVSPWVPPVRGLFCQHWKDFIISEIQSKSEGPLSHEPDLTIPSVISISSRHNSGTHSNSVGSPVDVELLSHYFYLQCNLHKENVSTGIAFAKLRKAFRIPRRDISFASIKPAEADTMQRIRLRGVAAQFALEMNSSPLFEFDGEDKKIMLSNFSYQREPLNSRHTWGDFYDITLRDVDPQNDFSTAFSVLQRHGFPNYFCQRFSWFAGKDDPGLAVLQGDFVRFAFLLLDFSLVPHTLRELLQRRLTYPLALQNAYRKEVIGLMRMYNIEPVELDRCGFFSPPEVGFSAMTERSAKYEIVRDILEQAYRELPGVLRRSLCQKFSCYCWNQVLTLRAQQFGLRTPMEGDLVVPLSAVPSGSPLDSVNAINALDVVTQKNINKFSILDVVHPHFSLNDGFLMSNPVASMYHQVCRKYSISWSSMIQEEKGITDFVGPLRRIIQRPESLDYRCHESDRTLTMQFALESRSCASALLAELMKIDSCAELETVVRPKTSQTPWEMGTQDAAYVPTFSDFYVTYSYNSSFDDKTHEDPVEVADLFVLDSDELFKPESEDPFLQAQEWSKKYLLRNSRRRRKQAADLRKELFGDTLSEQVSDADLGSYVEHSVPMPPNANRKRIQKLVRKTRNKRVKGIPHVHPVVSIGENVRSKKQPPFVALNKDTWNRVW